MRDYLLIKKDGSFHYQVDSLKKDGDWTLNGTTLTFNYKNGSDKIKDSKNFKVESISEENLVISLNNIKFEFEHNFSNKISMFSATMDNAFKPIVEKMASVIFWDVSSINIPMNIEENLEDGTVVSKNVKYYPLGIKKGLAGASSSK